MSLLAWMVYVLPGDTFAPTSRGVVRFDERAGPEAVRPMAKLAVGPGDFPFLAQVAGHQEGEPMWRSWLRYKRRFGRRASASHS